MQNFGQHQQAEFHHQFQQAQQAQAAFRAQNQQQWQNGGYPTTSYNMGGPAYNVADRSVYGRPAANSYYWRQFPMASASDEERVVAAGESLAAAGGKKGAEKKGNVVKVEEVKMESEAGSEVWYVLTIVFL